MVRPTVLYYSGATEHPYFIEEFRNLPSDIDFTPSDKNYSRVEQKLEREDIIASKTKDYGLLIKIARRIVRHVLLFTGLPRITPILTSQDFIFSGRYILHSNKPWAVNCEDVYVMLFHPFYGWNSAFPRYIIRQYLKSDKCKAILPWTKAAKKSILSTFDDPTIINKTKVMYPAVAPRVKEIKSKQSKNKNILFIGIYFLKKGGWETVLAFNKLKSKATLHIVSIDIPPDMKKKISKNKNIKLYSNIPDAEKDRLYRSADIFVMPSHMDTLGYVFLEAMSYGIPCIANDNFSAAEIISDDKDGFVIDNYSSYFDATYHRKKFYNDEWEKQLLNPPEWYVKQLASAMDTLLSDDSLRYKFSKAALEKIKTGRFSVKRKQEAIRELIKGIK